jgi:hypothetical protein
VDPAFAIQQAMAYNVPGPEEAMYQQYLQHHHQQQQEPFQLQPQHPQQQQQPQLSTAQLKAAKDAAVKLVKHALTNPYSIGRITKQQFADLAKAAGRGMYQRCKAGQLSLSQLEAAERLSPEELQQALLHHRVSGQAAAADGRSAAGPVHGAEGLHEVLEALQEDVNAAGAADVALV